MRRDEVEALIARHGADEVVRALRPYLTRPRQARIERVLSGRVARVEVAIESPSDPHNAAAVVRTAEALGILNVHVIAAEGDALHKKRTTQGAFHWVETHHRSTLGTFVTDVHGRGLVLAGATVDAASVLTDVPDDRPVCLLLGNETRGLSPGARQACDLEFTIPMFGMSESLNLSVSAAICLHDLLARVRERLGCDGDLEADDLAALRARYYVRSVDERLLRGLLA